MERLVIVAIGTEGPPENYEKTVDAVLWKRMLMSIDNDTDLEIIRKGQFNAKQKFESLLSSASSLDASLQPNHPLLRALHAAPTGPTLCCGSDVLCQFLPPVMLPSIVPVDSREGTLHAVAASEYINSCEDGPPVSTASLNFARQATYKPKDEGAEFIGAAAQLRPDARLEHLPPLTGSTQALVSFVGVWRLHSVNGQPVPSDCGKIVAPAVNKCHVTLRDFWKHGCLVSSPVPTYFDGRTYFDVLFTDAKSVRDLDVRKILGQGNDELCDWFHERVATRLKLSVGNGDDAYRSDEPRIFVFSQQRDVHSAIHAALPTLLNRLLRPAGLVIRAELPYTALVCYNDCVLRCQRAPDEGAPDDRALTVRSFLRRLEGVDHSRRSIDDDEEEPDEEESTDNGSVLIRQLTERYNINHCSVTAPLFQDVLLRPEVPSRRLHARVMKFFSNLLLPRDPLAPSPEKSITVHRISCQGGSSETDIPIIRPEQLSKKQNNHERCEVNEARAAQLQKVASSLRQRDRVLLFHGTNYHWATSVVAAIVPQGAKPSDFGPAFYTTPNIEYAWEAAVDHDTLAVDPRPAIVVYELPQDWSQPTTGSQPAGPNKYGFLIKNAIPVEHWREIVCACQSNDTLSPAAREILCRPHTDTHPNVITGPIAENPDVAVQPRKRTSLRPKKYGQNMAIQHAFRDPYPAHGKRGYEVLDSVALSVLIILFD